MHLNRLKSYVLNLKSEQGQSLTEIVISLGLIGLFVTAAVGAMAVALRNSVDVKTMQAATYLIQDYSDKVRAISEANWHTIYDLSKGSANSYMVVASGTQLLVVAGEESVLEGDIASGLVGHWKFDEATSTAAYDFSGNGNQGILTSGPTRTASSSCKAGSCLSFNGSSNYVDAGSGASLNITGAITVGAWVKTSNSATQMIVARGLSSSDHTYALYITNNHLKFNWANGTGFGEADILEGVTNIIDGNWHYLVGVGDPTAQKMYIYVDSVLDNSKSKTTVPSSNSTKVAIGNEFGYSVYFNGLIDDVRVYNRALSASEITQLYGARVYNREFYVDNVNRDSCGVGNITTNSTTTCQMETGSGYVANEPSTQKTTAAVSWEIGRSISQTQYISRYRNKIFDQTNWSGGSGQEGPITDINNKFTTSTDLNVTTTTGSILVDGF